MARCRQPRGLRTWHSRYPVGNGIITTSSHARLVPLHCFTCQPFFPSFERGGRGLRATFLLPRLRTGTGEPRPPPLGQVQGAYYIPVHPNLTLLTPEHPRVRDIILCRTVELLPTRRTRRRGPICLRLCKLDD